MQFQFFSHLEMYAACFACYISMIMCGMCLSWTEPLTSWFQSNSTNMNEEQISLVVSLVEAGAFVSPLPAAFAADKLGRKWVLILTGLVALASWLLAIFLRTFPSLCVSRILSGLALGASPTVGPVYLAEVVPASIRGALSGQLITMFFLGQVIVYASGHFLPYTEFLSVCSVVALLSIISLLLLPESPYFLLKKGKEEKAQEAMRRLRGVVDQEEFSTMVASIQRQGSSQHGCNACSQILTWDVLKILIILQLLSFISHMNGLPTLSLYATETFGGRAWLTVGMGGLLAGSSFIAAFFTDSIGRKPLLIISLGGSALFTAIIAAYFLAGGTYLLYIGVFGFCIVSSVGISPLIMTLQAELFPTSVRATASGITELTLSLASFLCLFIFLPINNHWGIHVNFIIYTVLSITGVLAVVLFLPETSRTAIDT